MASLPVGLIKAAEALAPEERGGSLLAWLRDAPDGSIRVSVASIARIEEARPEWQAIGPESGVALKVPQAGGKVSLQSWATRAGALSRTRYLLASVTAERWNALVAQCEILPDRIIRIGSDRARPIALGYRSASLPRAIERTVPPDASRGPKIISARGWPVPHEK